MCRITLNGKKYQLIMIFLYFLCKYVGLKKLFPFVCFSSRIILNYLFSHGKFFKEIDVIRFVGDAYCDWEFLPIYFADCSTSGLACLPLLQCPKVNEIALKIQELGVHETTRKLELLNIINHKLCGGRIKKELHVCCTIDEVEKVEDPSSVTPGTILIEVSFK